MTDVLSDQSTTPLFLNGDHRLNPLSRLRYYFYHSRRNRKGNARRLDREIYWPERLEDYISATDGLPFDRTPTRLLCNIFWSLIDWSVVRSELGRLSVHDIGCGSGRYGMLIRKFAGFELDYSGYDIAPYTSWNEFRDARTNFYLYDGHSYESTFEKVPNVFISQSALEHIPNDLAYFSAVSRYCRTLDRAVQIHMIPGATGLRQWGTHGWRQYNRDMLRRIMGVLDAEERMSVLCLGGQPLVELHVKWVHNRRKHKAIKRNPAAQESYKREWLEAVAACTPVGVDQAAFLCILIEKGLSAPLWPRLLRSSSAT